MATHAQVVVAAPHSHLTSRSSGCLGERLSQAVDVVEVAVTPVLLLLLNLVVAEAIIVKGARRLAHSLRHFGHLDKGGGDGRRQSSQLLLPLRSQPLTLRLRLLL